MVLLIENNSAKRRSIMSSMAHITSHEMTACFYLLNFLYIHYEYLEIVSCASLTSSQLLKRHNTQ